MAKYKTNSLGFPLEFNGPDTVEDYDRAAGRTGACLEDATDNTIYRSTLPEWMQAFATELEKLTGVPRGVDQEATQRAKARSKTPEKVKDVPEKVKAYHRRVTANMSDEQKNALNGLAQRVADGIVIDPSPAKRAAGPGKDVLAKADSILAGSNEEIEAKVEKFLSRVEGYELEREDDGKPERTSFARLIGQYLQLMLQEV